MTTEYERIIDEIKANMRDPGMTQKDNILKAAEVLERNNALKDIRDICAKLCKDLEKAEHIKKRHVQDSLPDKYKHVEKTRKDILIAQTDGGGNQTTEQLYTDDAVRPSSDNDEDNDDDNSDESLEELKERRKAEYKPYDPSDRYRRMANKAGGQSSNKSSYPQPKQRDDQLYQDDMEALKEENKQLRTIIRQKDALIDDLRLEIDALKRR